MIKLAGVQDIDRFCHDLDLAFAELDRGISDRFSQFSHKLFEELVRGTPQWTGDLTSAWNYSINYPDETYSPIPNKSENQQQWSKADVFYRGAEPAVSVALAKAAGENPTWRDIVYFENPAPIAESVENLQVLIRPVNLMNGRVAMVGYLLDKHSQGGSW